MSTPPDPLIGSDFAGCRVIRAVGRGASATVYEAQTADGRPRALKVFHSDRPSTERRARREIVAARRLAYPQLPRLYQEGTHQRHRFIEYEFIYGHTLRAVLNRTSRLPAPLAAEIMAQLLDVFQAIHAARIVHRDVNPSNILLQLGDERLTVRLIDFGIARLIGDPESDDQRERGPLGTPGYPAPEQMTTPGRADARADWYALGIVLYEMLTGRLHHSSVSNMVEADFRGVGVPQLTPLLQGLLQREPNRRSLDLPAWLKELDRLREGLAWHWAQAILSVGEAVPYQDGTVTVDTLEPEEPLRLGQYERGELISRESFTEIYRGRDLTSGQEVFLEIRRTLSVEWEGIAPGSEMALAGRFTHPNLQRIIADFATDPLTGLRYRVLEPLRGRTLLEFLRDTGPPPITDLLDIAEEALHGLAALHVSGLVHHDLKPGKLFLQQLPPNPTGPRWIVKITGLEYVHEMDGPNCLRPGVILGTPRFMPPEQLRGELGGSGPRSDLYALGVTLYELASGTSPFPGPSLTRLIQSVIAGPEPNLRQHRPDLPRPVRRWIERLMARQRARRFPSASAALSALQGVRQRLRPWWKRWSFGLL